MILGTYTLTMSRTQLAKLAKLLTHAFVENKIETTPAVHLIIQPAFDSTTNTEDVSIEFFDHHNKCVTYSHLLLTELIPKKEEGTDVNLER
jgi:hypothetical protein